MHLLYHISGEEGAFYNVGMAEKKKILGNINLGRRVPMSSYSEYGEFILDERYM